MLQIFENAGLDGYELMDGLQGYTIGFDIKKMQSGDMYKMGVIDPLKVTKNALKNAVSVSTTILSTNAIITMARA